MLGKALSWKAQFAGSSPLPRRFSIGQSEKSKGQPFSNKRHIFLIFDQKKRLSSGKANGPKFENMSSAVRSSFVFV